MSEILGGQKPWWLAAFRRSRHFSQVDRKEAPHALRTVVPTVQVKTKETFNTD